MDKETGVVQLDDLLGKELYPHSGVAEDYCLGDVQFTKKSVETVDFVLLVQIAVVLSYTFEGQFFHYIDSFTILHVIHDKSLYL